MNNFQILGLFDFTDTAISLMNGVYVLVGKLYSFMLSLSRATSVDQYSFTTLIEKVVDSFYVIAGVFMLFRLTVSVFGYIIDPDKLTDSKAGGSKLLTNVVLTLLLLILFYPTGVVYSALSTFERAFLYSDSGFFNNIFNKIKDKASDDNSITLTSNDQSYNVSFDKVSHKIQDDLFLVNDVYAKDLTCWYNVGTNNDNKVQYKIVFSRDDQDVVSRIKSFGKPATNQIINGVNNSISNKKFKNCNNLYVVQANTTNTAGCIGMPAAYAVVTKDNQTLTNKCYSASWGDGNTGVHQLYNTKKEAAAGKIAKVTEYKTKNSHHGLSVEAASFANSVEGSFFSCAGEGDSGKDLSTIKKNAAKESDTNINKYDGETCWEFEHVPLFIDDAPNKGASLVKNNRLDYYWIFGLVFGIALAVYIVILCVEVIVRNLKLVLYQMIAPIPIINGIDPNDKMRSRWLKAYFAAYLDLFMKMFAIQLLAKLVSVVAEMGDKVGAMGKIFFLIALFTFAKMVPNLISKILGIENLGGATKEISGMLKKGLGIGAGAAIGATVGGVTGMRAGLVKTDGGMGRFNRSLAIARGLGSGVTGGLRGAGSGAKGDVLSGAKNVSEANARSRKLYKSGLKPTDLMTAATLGKINQDYASRTDDKLQQLNEEKDEMQKFTPFKDQIEDAAEGSKFIKSLRQRMSQGQLKDVNGNVITDEKKLQDYRDVWADYQIGANKYGKDESTWMSQIQAETRAKIARGEMTQVEAEDYTNAYSNLLNRVSDVKSVASNNDVTFEVEGGKQSAIITAMTNANDLLAGNDTLKERIGSDHVDLFSTKTYARDNQGHYILDANGNHVDEDKFTISGGNTKVKQRASQIDREVYRRTTADPKYNIAKAAKGEVEKDKK